MKKSKGQDAIVKDQTNNASEVVENLVIEAPRATISHELLEQFERFYEYHPAKRLSRNLRSLLLEFLMYDGSAEAEYLRDLVIDLDGLFSLLDVMEEEAEKLA